MKIIFLGTGSAGGIPTIHCKCKICKLAKAGNKNFRTRSSIAIIENDKILIVDMGPDYRIQILREKLSSIDIAIITHNHMDHTFGIDNLRRENKVILKTLSDVIKRWKPELKRIKTRNPKFRFEKIKLFKWQGISIEPIGVKHNKPEYKEKMPCIGLLFKKGQKKVAYLSDFNKILEMKKIQNLDLMVVGTSGFNTKHGHLGINDLIKIYKKLNPKKMLITHISHNNLSHEKLKKYCKKFGNIEPAYDGMKIEM